MDWSPLHRRESAHFGGSEIRDGKIFASNSGLCVEDRYPTAYNLGCGKRRWPGWIGVDLDEGAELQADIRQLPIESDSADAIAAIHVVEHMYEWDVHALFIEWKRVLKPGGKMILELPCGNKVADYMGWAAIHKVDMLPFMSIHALYGDAGKDHNIAMTHKFLWFIQPLRIAVEKAGFVSARVLPAKYHFPCRDFRIEAVK